MRENVCLGLFQTKIIEGWVKPLLEDTADVMITPLMAGEGQLQEARPLPPGLHIFHAFTHLKNGSSSVLLMVRNMSNSHIFLKKGVLVACVVSVSPVPLLSCCWRWKLLLGQKPNQNPCQSWQGRRSCLRN